MIENPSSRKVDCRYGAPMGRRSDSLSKELPVRLARVHVDEQGYDPGGAYWGTGPALWVAWDDDGNERYFRAPTREAALATLNGFTVVDGEPTDDFDAFFDAYLTCALWSSTGDDDEPLDRQHDVSDLHPDAREKLRVEARAFYDANRADIGDSSSQAGHDYWLKRNGHGAGFTDREKGVFARDAAERLADAARRAREVYIYIGDDGKLHV